MVLVVQFQAESEISWQECQNTLHYTFTRYSVLEYALIIVQISSWVWFHHPRSQWKCFIANQNVGSVSVNISKGTWWGRAQCSLLQHWLQFWVVEYLTIRGTTRVGRLLYSDVLAIQRTANRWKIPDSFKLYCICVANLLRGRCLAWILLHIPQVWREIWNVWLHSSHQVARCLSVAANFKPGPNGSPKYKNVHIKSISNMFHIKYSQNYWIM